MSCYLAYAEPMPTKLSDTVVGSDTLVMTQGGQRPYINLDNAASTPPFQEVVQSVLSYAPWYSSIHRGNGLKSRISTRLYEDARQVVGGFVGASLDEHVVIFGKNTTEAINKLSYRLGLHRKDIVLISGLEHHSNDLPWRAKATVKRIKTLPDGSIDKQHFLFLLGHYQKRIRLVAISGASNVTGHIPDIHWFAREAHAIGARIFVDCAQLFAHRPIDMKRLDNPDHIDYIAFSAHKAYAPFGTGALVGRKDTFIQGAPEYSGGGTISSVTPTTVDWALTPDRDEAGSPNVVGVIALVAAVRTLQQIGFDVIRRHETSLTRYALEKLGTNKVKLYGNPDPAYSKFRSGVIPFTMVDVPSNLVAAILGHEWGIGVRSGCFCAQSYVMNLLGLSRQEQQKMRSHILHYRRDVVPGMVRISFGIYNTKQEIDLLAQALEAIASGNHGEYTVDEKTGQYSPTKNRFYLET